MKVIFTLFIIAFGILFADAQIDIKTLKTVARSGWTEPVFADKVKKTEEGYPIYIEGIDIQTKEHKFAKERFVFVETCKADTVQETIDNKSIYAVRGFRTYEVKGKTFAYFIYYVGVAASENSFGYLGCARPSYYVDEDGDGKFKLRCEFGLSLRNIPQWVKKLAKNDIQD
jgi:hypothetical protein